jgi:hypothetical protein
LSIARECETPIPNTAALLGSFERQDLAWLPGQLRNVFDAIRDGPDNAARLQNCV